MKNVKYYVELNIDTLINYISKDDLLENNLLSSLRKAEEKAIKEILEDGEYNIQEAVGSFKKSVNHNKIFDFDDFDYTNIALLKKYTFRQLAFHYLNQR